MSAAPVDRTAAGLPPGMPLTGPPPPAAQAAALGAPDIADDGVPVFGRPEAPSYEPFRLWIAPDGGEPYQEEYSAHIDADAGAIMELLAARSQLAQGAAMARLLAGILRNDDGIPVEYVPPALPEMDADGFIVKDDAGRPLYRDWNGDLTAEQTLLVPEHEAGSSRRRFAAVMDAPNLRVTMEALSEIAQWVVTRSGGRPTRRQGPSPTTARQRDGGSRGKSRSRASGR